eukprot:COSAG02_NODE_52016_length_310_cov_1.194313_2_plen_29_part_01
MVKFNEIHTSITLKLSARGPQASALTLTS